MQMMNKKFMKEIKSIFVSSEKAKKLALAELDKIDAKYKALAEKEKAELNNVVKNLDAMLDMYRPLIESSDEPVIDSAVDDTLPFSDDDVVEEPEVTEEPVEAAAEEPVIEAEVPAEQEPEFDGAGFTAEDNKEPETVAEEQPVEESEESEEVQNEDEDDEWGDKDAFMKEW